MKLIAKKPCSFGGRQFFIGEEIPACLVASPESQEKLEVLAIVKTRNEEIAADAVAELKETDAGAYDRVITIFVAGEADDGMLEIPVTDEEIQQVFSIMQMNADDGAKAVSDVENKNVLILLLAADSRKTVKDAARKRAGNLSVQGDSDAAGAGSEATDTDTGGADA